jgi:hypothetical protein
MMDLPILIDKDWVLKMEVFSFSSESTGGSREPNKGNLCPSGPVLHVDSDFQGRKIEHPGPRFQGAESRTPWRASPRFQGAESRTPWHIFYMYIYYVWEGCDDVMM